MNQGPQVMLSMVYKPKYINLNWGIEITLFYPNMEILGSFVAGIKEL
jgi:hypothetical protein